MRTFKHLTALSAIALLAACGGGGGGDSSAPAPAPAPAPGPAPAPTPAPDVVVSSGSLVTSVPAPTYTASTVEADVYSTLNAVRASANAGLQRQSTMIDTAAAAHAKYLTTNLAVTGLTHNENSSYTHYYESTPSSRIAKSGFQAGPSSEIIGGTGADRLGSGCVLGLLNSVYHGAAALSPFTTVGVGIGTDLAGIPMCVINFATASSETFQQVFAAGSLLAYPYAGQTTSLSTFCVDCESPRPPESVLPKNFTWNSLYTMAGAPVLVSVRNADFVNFKSAGTLDVQVTKFELKDAGGNVIPAAFMFASSVKASGFTAYSDTTLPEGFALLVPTAPLNKLATYTVTFTATLKSGGTPLTKTWSFTTSNEY